MEKAFIPFSWGPRACIAKKLAKIELLQIVATIFRRYDMVPEDENMKVSLCNFFLLNSTCGELITRFICAVGHTRGLYLQYP